MPADDKARWRAVYMKLKSAQASDGKLPLLTLDEFFDGNDDEGSIGCNLIDHPGIATFYQTLRQIEARADVQYVRVAISDLNEYETPELTEEMATWPFSDTLFIATSAPAATIRRLLQPLQPDEVGEQLSIHAPIKDSYTGYPALDKDCDLIIAWWD